MIRPQTPLSFASSVVASFNGPPAIVQSSVSSGALSHWRRIPFSAHRKTLSVPPASLQHSRSSFTSSLFRAAAQATVPLCSPWCARTRRRPRCATRATNPDAQRATPVPTIFCATSSTTTKRASSVATSAIARLFVRISSSVILNAMLSAARRSADGPTVTRMATTMMQKTPPARPSRPPSRGHCPTSAANLPPLPIAPTTWIRTMTTMMKTKTNRIVSDTAATIRPRHTWARGPRFSLAIGTTLLSLWLRRRPTSPTLQARPLGPLSLPVL